MNLITYAGPFEGCPSKGLAVVAPVEKGAVFCRGKKLEYDEGCAVILPRFENADASSLTGCPCAVIEGAFYPVKSARVTGGKAGATVRVCIERAIDFYGGGLNSMRVLSALADVISACLAADPGESLSPVTRQLADEMDAHISDPFFSLSDSIKKIPLNYDYIRKLFRRETGLTPHGYLIKKRMELAAEIIASRAENRYSNYSVAQIAEVCGFSEPLYFSRIFKKYYGLSPSDYAKNL